MRILALWVVNYYSGSTSERFLRPLKELGHTVDIIPLEEGNVEARLIESVKTGEYDLLLHLPYPGTVRLEVIKALPIISLAWNGDDEWYWDVHREFSEKVAESHDYCATTYKSALSHYRKGILATWGYSNQWFRRASKKDIDIYFCGSRNHFRDMYIQSLVRSGFNIKVDGPGYSGKIKLKDMIENYRRAKIGLSFVSENKDEFMYQQIKARTFEIPALGTFQLSEECHEIGRFFKRGEQIETFTSERDLFDKCKKYLNNDKLREQIAYQGFLRNKSYTYEKTFKNIFNKIKEDYEA